MSEAVLRERAEAVLRALLEKEFPGGPVLLKPRKSRSAWSAVHERSLYSIAFRSRVFRESRAVLASTGGKILALEAWREDPANCPGLQRKLAELEARASSELDGEALKALQRIVRRALLEDVSLPADEPRPLLSVSLEHPRELAGYRMWLGLIFEQLSADPSIHLDARDASLFTWNLPHRRRPRPGRLVEAVVLERAAAALRAPEGAQFRELLTPEHADGCFRVIYERFVDGYEVEGDFLLLDLHPADGQPVRMIRSWSQLDGSQLDGDINGTA